MSDLFQKLPSVLILAVLVGIFLSLRHHSRSPRVRLWVAAWGLVFFHFLVQLFEPRPGLMGSLALALDLSALMLAGVVFLVSLTTHAEVPRQRYFLMALLGAPCLAFALAGSLDVTGRAPYLAAEIVFFAGGLAVLLLWHGKLDSYAAGLGVVLGGLGSWGIYAVARNDLNAGLAALLAAVFALPGLLFARRYPRWSPGVVTSVGGFLAWGAVFPVGYLLDTYLPKLQVSPELWNVPKFFVAFGMIVSLLEDESAAAEVAKQREQATVREMQRFADITSRLLGGVDVKQFCHQIAQTILEASNFQRVAILMSDDDRKFYVAGHAGLTPEAAATLQASVRDQEADSLGALCASARRIGQNSYQLTYEQMASHNPVRSRRQYPPNPFWKNGDEVVIPLVSAQGRWIGCLSLDDPKDVERLTAEEMSKVELLAADLAVAVENATLQRQLTRSEKLAGIGQLVAGVAHELNNPLTAVLGYSELLAEEVQSESALRKVDSLNREAQRMKRIIQNLLRFARQNKPGRQRVELLPLIQDVLALREYHLNSRSVRLEVRAADGLPAVAGDEDQLKQVLLNVLNNAVDAVETESEKRITIEVVTRRERLAIEFSDNGCGFAEPERAFDPFYTTKPVGKGTGLGLSICYGILKEHGGEIHVANLQPRGARVTIELPVREGEGLHAPLADASRQQD
jgi:two-component system NtrC family sensor kinase